GQINLGGGMDAPRILMTKRPDATIMTTPAPPIEKPTPEEMAKVTAEQAAQAQVDLEKKQLDALMQDLKEAINKSQALEPFKDQLLLDITPEGLRIQIVDAQNRPMFDLGGARLKGYTNSILKELTPYLNSVPNHISLTGHTDTTPYAGITGYTNWDLSTDRANAARRSLEAAGLGTDRVSRVVGLSSSVLFDKANPRSPVNRRISIVVMTQKAEMDALRTDAPLVAGIQGPAGASP
ncbi:MAG: OmpA family protein, partial [Gammaproteobacteria bacterium]